MKPTLETVQDMAKALNNISVQMCGPTSNPIQKHEFGRVRGIFEKFDLTSPRIEEALTDLEHVEAFWVSPQEHLDKLGVVGKTIEGLLAERDALLAALADLTRVANRVHLSGLEPHKNELARAVGHALNALAVYPAKL